MPGDILVQPTTRATYLLDSVRPRSSHPEATHWPRRPTSRGIAAIAAILAGARFPRAADRL